MSQKEMSFEEKVKTLKSYIQRVTDGEDMETVQLDFKENFSDVPAKEIAKAEQIMMADGAKMEDIQKLCDIHSVLFEDMTDEERMQRLKEEMEAHQVKQADEKIENVEEEVSKKTIELKNTHGHPLNILTVENDAIKSLINQIRCNIHDNLSINDEIKQLMQIKKHYAKKDDLLFPLLKGKYDYSGPADVMWAVEDEIKSQLGNSNYEEDVLKVIKRVEEMIFKEENILFPLCVENFSDEEWINIAEDMHSYGPCLVDSLPKWDKSIDINENMILDDDIISLPGGTLTLKQLRAILNILPMEITIIDEKNINRFFDEDQNKVFARPKMALNRDVFLCHPKRVRNMVSKLIEDFKSGTRDSMHVISTVDGVQVLTNYYALKDINGDYLGTMEAVLHIDGIVNCAADGKKGSIKPDIIFPN
ncbi:MAG: DUF438 domain-containing protein [Methanosphaera stadtmanae]|nr:DUF438 domain-containing protein [Methanosphaera stadtmanae]